MTAGHRDRVMGAREARRYLLRFAADLLRNAAFSDPICDRRPEHPDSEANAERETAVLQREIPWVTQRLEALARGAR
ncbi:MAG TPA: hypothetical protein VFX59_01805 [Polyangiales bacterium]|nr:hypothetical protein [Polyangiales bacterium]